MSRGTRPNGQKETSKKFQKPLDKPPTLWYNKGVKRERKQGRF